MKLFTKCKVELPENAKERLMAASLPLFAEKGLEGTSTRDIAKAADLNISLISYYFGGKEGLYKAAILEHGKKKEEMISTLVEPYLKGALTRESLTEFFSKLVELILTSKLGNETNRHIDKIMLREELNGLPYLAEVYEQIYSRVTEYFERLITQAQKQGLVSKKVRAKSFIIMMVHGIDGYITCFENDGRTSFAKDIIKTHKDLPSLRDEILQIYLEGLLL
jgi:AcrR family transcriptional regulator